jgi:hypothetical protein
VRDTATSGCGYFAQVLIKKASTIMRKTNATVADLPSPATANKFKPAAACGPIFQRRRCITLDDIRYRAYLKWEAAGKPDGDSTHFWLEAEAELLKEKQDHGSK